MDRIALLILLVASASACTLTTKGIDELQYPGFIDVGAGYAVAYNTHDGANNDADGYLLSIKAYPFGRWYAKPKATQEQALSKASEALVQAQVDQDPAKLRPKVEAARQHVRQARQKKAALSTDPAARATGLAECLGCVGAARELLDEIPRADPGTQDWTDAIRAQLQRARQELDPPAPPAGAAAPGAPAATTPPAPAATTPAGADPLAEAEAALSRQLTKLEQAEKGFAAALAKLGQAQGELLNEEFYVVEKDGESWWPRLYRRFSVFYGTSISDFDGGGLESSVNAVGLGFDVAPQLALLFGWGYYEVDDGTGADTDSGFVAAVSLNLNAFRWMFGDLAD